MRASPPPKTSRPALWRRIVCVCVIVWTVWVGTALWWLLLSANAGSQVWIVREAGPTQTGLAEKGLSFSSSEPGLQRVYPWVLFGPYVALLAMLFPLEQGRFRLAVPVSLAACLAFVIASQAINARTRVSFGSFMLVKNGEANRISVRVLGADPEKVRLEDVMKGHGVGSAPGARPADAVTGERPGENVSNITPKNLPEPMLLHKGVNFPLPRGERKSSLGSILVDLLAYGAVIGLAHSIHFYRRFRERERRALFLESNLASARLNALRAQLQPHFLFNSLNAVAALLRRDPRLAEATLMSLSELLRLALSQSAKQEIVMREEMQFVERYLEIQQTRFGDKLRVEQDIEPAALDCLVPALVLQPLIENAIRHGIEPSEEAGLVRLAARCQGDKLVMTVEDDGVGLINDTSRNGNGIGLANLGARLETLYGDCQKLELTPRPERGVTVRLEIPWRPAPASEMPGASNPA